jgi:hypothetical protein
MLKVRFAYNYDPADTVSNALFFSQTYFDHYIGYLNSTRERYIEMCAYLKRIYRARDQIIEWLPPQYRDED